MKHRARKRFGQNFLRDPRVIQRIVDTVNPQADQLIVEVGPGRGALTAPLVSSGAELKLLEIDRELAAQLEMQYRDCPQVSVHTGDVLRMDLGEVTGGRSFRLLGNLPYNISTPLIFHVLKWSERIRDMHFMLQHEVVERMAAPPGGKARGKLSVMCQYRCQVQPLFTVPPEAFSPVPKVHSALVRLVPHQQPPVAVDDPAGFAKLVSHAFSMRRKTLRNSLRGLLEADQIERAGVDPGARAETLSMEQFAALAALMK
ncbi:MAG: 16S rRNA (adenine(1518)-N(6)/adenine(1519)-N(6))-dimethyltransferase RsmA [Xanthomonadales bacterium]|nr:16S rRNA (adenine(1518)-N(6)/adenine(1519)-N(6))-dimethyltransferase RsmA [Xanthomonadales bacterium]